MRIEFDDKSYIEFRKSTEIGKVVITIQAKDAENPLKKITNTCEITIDQFNSLYNSLLENNGK